MEIPANEHLGEKRMLNRKCLLVTATLISFSSLEIRPLVAEDRNESDSQTLRTIDYLVPHISTVPANAGKQVELFVGEKVAESEGKRHVVLIWSQLLQRSLVPLAPSLQQTRDFYRFVACQLCWESFGHCRAAVTSVAAIPTPQKISPLL